MGWTMRKRDRAGFAVMAMLALLVQFAVPQGFMLARSGDAPALVICTGHGPLAAPVDDHGLPGKAPKQQGVCAFAGHGGAASPPAFANPLGAYSNPAVAASRIAAVASPGRGLAAPPPPSQAPPLPVV